MSELLDQDARDAIRTGFGRNLFVEAGAGTGKTSELVRRVVAMVAHGEAELRFVVAITFTEAAAAELRERLRKALEEAAVDADLTERERERCVVGRSQIDEAAISTIHAFAQRILRTHPTEANLPPVFEVHDQVQAKVAFRARWHELLSDTLASPEDLDPDTDDVLRTGLALGLSLRQLQGLLALLENHWHAIDAFLQTPAVRRPVLSLDDIRFTLTPAFDLVEHCSDESDAMSLRLQNEFRPWLAALDDARARGELAALSVLGQAPSFKKAGRKNNWGGCHDEVITAVSSTGDVVQRELQKFERYVLDHLLRLVGGFVLRTAEQRRKKGSLEFHDLLVFARNALRDNAAVRRQQRMAYQYVLVDEFQDTDQLQAEIVDLLTQPRADDSGEPAKLFTVGDPKQSIYRFRNADPDLFHEFRTRAGDDVVGLNTNFRTLPAVVEWVNAVFAELLQLTHDRTRIDLFAGRLPGHESAAGSVTLLGQQHPKGVKSAAIRRDEAEDIVANIRAARAEGWTVQGSNGLRAARYGDMAILMPTRTSLPILERALRLQGVPYRIESRSLIWSTQEIRDVLSIAAAVEDPHDTNAIIASLRSPAFGCSDRDLLDWARMDRDRGVAQWSYLQLLTPALLATPVGEAMAGLRALHEGRWWRTVPEMIQAIISQRSMFELAFAHARQRESWARLRFITDRARAWMEDGGSSMRAFLRWAAVQTDENADALESVVPETDDDAVRIMTIHASKGLEFPIVFLTGLNSKGSRSDSARLLWDDGGLPLARLGSKDRGWQSLGFADAVAADDEEERREQLRLAYVGATRARDHLVISVHRPFRSSTGTAVPVLAEAIAEAHTRLELITPPPAAVVPPVEAEAASIAAIDLDNVRQARRDAIARGSREVSFSATGLTTAIAGEYVAIPGVGLRAVLVDDATDTDHSIERLSFGTAVHAVLEVTAFDAVVDTARCAAAAAAAGVAHRAKDVEKSVGYALSSEPVRAALAAKRYWRELSVASHVGDLIINGQADLVYEREDGGLVVVDYKTDTAPTAQDQAHLLQRYQWQLLTYARAISNTLDRPVVDAMIVLLSPLDDGPTVIGIPDLPTADQRFEEQVARLRLTEHGA